MKLRNKETGEVVTVSIISTVKFENDDETPLTLENLYERYEDVPEEKKPWEEVVKIGYRIAAPDLQSPPLLIADQDYYELLPDGTKKTRFTWEEAMEIEKKTNGKWRLPTPQEFAQTVLYYGFDDEGIFRGERFAERLNLTTEDDKRLIGGFWSRTASSTTNAMALFFDDNSVNPQGNEYKALGFSVRCVNGARLGRAER